MTNACSAAWSMLSLWVEKDSSAHWPAKKSATFGGSHSLGGLLRHQSFFFLIMESFRIAHCIGSMVSQNFVACISDTGISTRGSWTGSQQDGQIRVELFCSCELVWSPRKRVVPLSSCLLDVWLCLPGTSSLTFKRELGGQMFCHRKLLLELPQQSGRTSPMFTPDRCSGSIG